MLSQFLSTTHEIQCLVTNQRVQNADKTKLNFMLGQEMGDENLAERIQLLEEVNQRLAAVGLRESSVTKITMGTLGLSHIPESVIKHLSENHATLETISLRDNDLTSLPHVMLTLEFPCLKTLNLDGNRLDESNISEILNRFANINVSIQGQKGHEIEETMQAHSRSYLPSGGITRAAQANNDIDVEKHKTRANVEKFSICSLQ